MVFLDPGQEQTYTLGGSFPTIGIDISGVVYNTSWSGSGNFAITSYSATKLSGTFNCIAKNQNGSSSITITNGVFTNIPGQ